MSGLLWALIVAGVGSAISGFWFGFHRRQAVEAAAGIQSLANLKWRECIGLVLEALGREGYKEAPSSRQPGEGSTEYLLIRGDEKVLLSYKHGTAYRLGEANVRDFGNGVQLAGAAHGILVTLGSVEGLARDLAKRLDVDLVDGQALWPKVKDYVPESIRHTVKHQAAEQTQKGLWAGIGISLLLAAVAFFALGDDAASEPSAAANAEEPVPTLAAASSTPAIDPTLQQIQDTAKAMAEVEKLTPTELAERRAAAAKQVATIPQVNTAAWSTQSTLLMTLKQTDGKDQAMIEESCRILTQYEELRFTRLQLEPPAESQVPVRWRQCQ